MKKDLISIIIPVYNVEQFLEKCLDSVITQTYTNLEIIVVDDGSPDSCPKICDQYAKKDKRIKVIHQNNKGLSGARNTGVKNCTSEWYMFVDGDDYIYADAIETLVKEIEPNIDLICTKTIGASSVENISSYPYIDKKVYKTEKDLYYLKCSILDLNGNNSSSCGKLYSKKFTDKFKLFHNEELKQGAEDLEFNFRVFSKARKIKMLQYKFYQCVYNSHSITRSFNIENEYLKIKCFRSIKQYIPNNDFYMLEKFNNRFCYSIINSAISGFFNPKNNLSFSEQKRQFKAFINIDILKEALLYKNIKTFDNERKITIFLIEHNFFIIIKLLAHIRYYQKKILSKKDKVVL